MSNSNENVLLTSAKFEWECPIHLCQTRVRMSYSPVPNSSENVLFTSPKLEWECPTHQSQTRVRPSYSLVPNSSENVLLNSGKLEWIRPTHQSQTRVKMSYLLSHRTLRHSVHGQWTISRSTQALWKTCFSSDGLVGFDDQFIFMVDRGIATLCGDAWYVYLSIALRLTRH